MWPQEVLVKLLSDNKLSDEDTIKKFLHVFYFNKLVNINPRDEQYMMAHIKLLNQMSTFDVFYASIDRIENTLEFVLVNLHQMGKVFNEALFTAFLELFQNIIINIKQNIAIYTKVVDKNRIFDILDTLLHLEQFQKKHARNFVKIFINLLMMSGATSFNIAKLTEDILEKLSQIDAKYESVRTCHTILRNIPINTEIFIVNIRWLLDNAPTYLASSNESTVFLLLHTINYCFYTISCNTKKNLLPENVIKFLEEFLKISDAVCKCCCNPKLLKLAIPLFSYIMHYLANHGKLYLPPQFKVLEEMNKLSQDISKWPTSNCDMFFYICQCLISTSRLLWTNQEVLSAISDTVHSTKSNHINPNLLKTLCFLYPVVSEGENDVMTSVLGEDLMRLLSNNFSCFTDEDYCNNLAQCKWMLNWGTRHIKTHVLTRWLLKESSTKLIATIVKECYAENTLLEVLEGKNTDQGVISKAVETTYGLNNQKLSLKIFLRLTQTISDKPLFNTLMTCNLLIPEDQELSLKICVLLTELLPSLSEKTVVIKVCELIRKLLSSLRHNELLDFTSKSVNLEFLVENLGNGDEEIAAAYSHLLKILLLVQNRNHLKSSRYVHVDIAPYLDCASIRKTEKLLYILELVLKNDQLIVRLSEASAIEISLKLYILANDLYWTSKSLKCLRLLLKRNPSLCYTWGFTVFIDLQCSTLPINEQAAQYLRKLIKFWLDIMLEKLDWLSCSCLSLMPSKNVDSFIVRLLKSNAGDYLKKLSKIREACSTYVQL